MLTLSCAGREAFGPCLRRGLLGVGPLPADRPRLPLYQHLQPYSPAVSGGPASRKGRERQRRSWQRSCLSSLF